MKRTMLERAREVSSNLTDIILYSDGKPRSVYMVEIAMVKKKFQERTKFMSFVNI
jgi:hypothetical protein